MKAIDFASYSDPQRALECCESHIKRGFTVSTAVVVTMVLHGSEIYGADVIAPLRDWVLNNTRGTDVE